MKGLLLSYGNTGNGVSRPGIKNQLDFYLNTDCLTYYIDLDRSLILSLYILNRKRLLNLHKTRIFMFFMQKWTQNQRF